MDFSCLIKFHLPIATFLRVIPIISDANLAGLSNLQNKVVTTAYNLFYQMKKIMVRFSVFPKDVVSSHLLCENKSDLLKQKKRC